MTRVASAGTVVMALWLASPAAALGICVEGDYPPFSEVLADGSIVGFDIDIATALCTQMGETCELVRTRWERMIPTLAGGGCDAIVASMSDTTERREQIDFSAVYYKTPVRFVAAADQDFADSPDALAGKVVGVQRGTTNELFMEAHYPATTLRLYGNQEHVLLDLTLGRLDAVLGEQRQLETGFTETPAGAGFALVGDPHFDPAIQGEGAAVGVRKEDTGLRDRFSDAIAAIRADGTYAAISERWFGEDIYGG